MPFKQVCPWTGLPEARDHLHPDFGAGVNRRPTLRGSHTRFTLAGFVPAPCQRTWNRGEPSSPSWSDSDAGQPIKIPQKNRTSSPATPTGTQRAVPSESLTLSRQRQRFSTLSSIGQSSLILTTRGRCPSTVEKEELIPLGPAKMSQERPNAVDVIFAGAKVGELIEGASCFLDVTHDPAGGTLKTRLVPLK